MGNELQPRKPNMVETVEARVGQLIRAGQLHIPPSYSAPNALRSAYLILQSATDKDRRPVLEACTNESIANSLLDMVVQGLNPMKKQCYFIAYGKSLVCQRSYFGTVHLVKTLAKARDVYACVVYAEDKFQYRIERGRKVVTLHEQELANIDPERIVAAYAVVVLEDGSEVCDIMTIEQIRKSWSKSKNNPDSPTSVHSQFAEEMAKKTVISRACKAILNSSTDSELLLEAMERPDIIAAEAELLDQIETSANKETLQLAPPADEPVKQRRTRRSAEMPAASTIVEPQQQPTAQPEQQATAPTATDDEPDFGGWGK